MVKYDSVFGFILNDKMTVSVYCKQRIIQLYCERKASYGKIAEILKAEGLKSSKRLFE